MTLAPTTDGLEPGTPFSLNIIAMAMHLRFVRAASYKHLTRLLLDLFGLSISEGALDAAFRRGQPRFNAEVSAIVARPCRCLAGLPRAPAPRLPACHRRQRRGVRPAHEGAAAARRGAGPPHRDLAASTRRQRRRRLGHALDAVMALQPAARDGRRLRKRRAKVRDHLFTFLDHPELAADNNSSERELRPTATYRKVTGGFRSGWVRLVRGGPICHRHRQTPWRRCLPGHTRDPTGPICDRTGLSS